MHRFFIPAEGLRDGEAILKGEEHAHLSHVLRLKKGETACLCDGNCTEYIAEILEVKQNETRLKILEHYASETEPGQRITLYQALPKAGKMETIIQKCVELGVSNIQPVYSARCVVKPGKDENKLGRYQRVALEAAKQSQRGIIPRVLPFAPLEGCIFSGHDLLLLAYEEEKEISLKQVLQCRGSAVWNNIAIIIGPEGGFEEEEVMAMRVKGAVPVSLGRRILRTETAGMAMLAMVQYELA